MLERLYADVNQYCSAALIPNAQESGSQSRSVKFSQKQEGVGGGVPAIVWNMILTHARFQTRPACNLIFWFRSNMMAVFVDPTGEISFFSPFSKEVTGQAVSRNGGSDGECSTPP